MKRQILYLIIPFLLLPVKSISQEFKVTQLKLDFDADQLLISYDFINNKKSDQFYVWVEMEKKNGTPIRMKTLSGDLGENIKGGKNKRITWLPGIDSVYLNEEVFVAVKAERYIRSFKRGHLILLSAALPGLGQTALNTGKPWWLTGVAAYATIASGLIIHKISLSTYYSYRSQQDPLLRDDKFIKSQKQMNVSNALIISGVVLWMANILWVTLIPERYQPLQHFNLSLDQSVHPKTYAPQLTFRSNF